MTPSASAVEARLMAILARGSVNLGATAGTERLMLMLTRSCHLRCAYCFVAKTETGPTLPLATARRALDLLFRSQRPKLEVQLFGGEPTSAWPVLEDVVRTVASHPGRAGRPVDLILTTNGLGLDPDRIAFLADHDATVLFSLDGDASAHRRYRAVHIGDDDVAYAGILRALDELAASDVRWFMNAVVPPAAASEVPARYAWARAHDVPALQLNYAVGMRWTAAQADAYLTGLVEVLHAHHADPAGMVLYNWRSDCEPVMLSDDLIVDVDGTVLHDGAIFLERVFPALKQNYRRGHLDDLDAFDPLRWSLARLYEVMVQTYPDDSPERALIVDNIRLGAAVDLVIQQVRRELGR